MSAAPVRTAAELKARRTVLASIAERRRKAQYCSRGHKAFKRKKNGRRYCSVCDADRSFGYRLQRKLNATNN